MIRAMAEEFPRCRVDPVGAPAEIDPVEVKLDDLVFGEFALEGEGEDAFLDLTHEIAVAGQEDVAGELLRDGRGGADPAALHDCSANRPSDADRVDPDMAPETAILGRDQRCPHFGRDAVIGQPLSETRSDRHQHLAISRSNPDHLAEVGALGQFAVARQIGRRDRHRHDQRKNRQDGCIERGL